jgi:Mn2+/Fe2+ NRAMP family transporter
MKSKAALWGSYVLSALPALFLLSGGVNAVRKADFVMEGFTKQGYPEHLAPALGVVQFVCALLYIIPRTSVLGAILLTGYFGGAVATHVRLDDPLWVVPVVFGVFVWAGLYLREDRLRSLIPLKHN